MVLKFCTPKFLSKNPCLSEWHEGPVFVPSDVAEIEPLHEQCKSFRGVICKKACELRCFFAELLFFDIGEEWRAVREKIDGEPPGFFSGGFAANEDDDYGGLS